MLIALRNFKSKTKTGTSISLLKNLLNKQGIYCQNLTLLSRSYLDQVNKSGESALFIALKYNNQEVAELLLEHKASIIPAIDSYSTQLLPTNGIPTHLRKKFSFFTEPYSDRLQNLMLQQNYCSVIHAAARWGNVRVLKEIIVQIKDLNLGYLINIPLGRYQRNVIHEMILSSGLKEKLEELQKGDRKIKEAIQYLAKNIDPLAVTADFRNVYDLINSNPYLLREDDNGISIIYVNLRKLLLVSVTIRELPGLSA